MNKPTRLVFEESFHKTEIKTLLIDEDGIISVLVSIEANKTVVAYLALVIIRMRIIGPFCTRVLLSRI